MKNFVVAATAVFIVLTMSLWATPGSDERRGWIQVGGDDQPVTQGSFRNAEGQIDQKGSRVTAVIFSPFNCSEKEVKIQLTSELDWHSNSESFIESESGRITGEIEPTTVRPIVRCTGR
jgi:hypothetical protein